MRNKMEGLIIIIVKFHQKSNLQTVFQMKTAANMSPIAKQMCSEIEYEVTAFIVGLPHLFMHEKMQTLT